MAPCWLSYYNVAVGGLSGAAKIGLQVTYWGDGVTRTFLADVALKVPPGTQVAAVPSLVDSQWPELWRQSPELKRRNVRYVPWQDDGPRPAYVLLFARPEYLPQEFRGTIDKSRIVAAVRRQGVVLAALIKLP